LARNAARASRPPGRVPRVWQARRPRSRQPAQRRASPIVEALPADTLAPLTRLSGRIRLRNADSEPKCWPTAVTLGEPDPHVVPSLKIVVSAGGAPGAKR
jgi:hypothetical protein